ncbi:hypothetical protein GN244_ATG05092 [Phytophthora infestans]|nr:hypothetical protein GN244_ATG05092 [Phytophthora infestans]
MYSIADEEREEYAGAVLPILLDMMQNKRISKDDITKTFVAEPEPGSPTAGGAAAEPPSVHPAPNREGDTRPTNAPTTFPAEGAGTTIHLGRCWTSASTTASSRFKSSGSPCGSPLEMFLEII